jgi:hypothetical protein
MKKYERKNNLQIIRKIINTIAGICKCLSIITQNVNGFNSPITKCNWLTGFKNKTQLFVVCKKQTFLA